MKNRRRGKLIPRAAMDCVLQLKTRRNSYMTESLLLKVDLQDDNNDDDDNDKHETERRRGEAQALLVV